MDFIMKSKKPTHCDVVVLYKDHHYDSMPSNEFIYSKDMKYILIPISDIDGHIMIKANEYMTFDKASISYSLQPRRIDWEEDEMEVSPMETVDVECTDIVELYNYIHTLYKLSYSDYVLHKTFKENDMVFDIGRFHIRLYKNNQIIFEIDYGMDLDCDEFIAAASDDSACRELKEMLKPIFSSPKSLYETSKHILIFKNNRWKMIKRSEADSHEKVLCGVPMLYSSTMYFCPIEEFNLYDEFISHFYTTIVMVESSYLEEMSENEKWEAVSEGDYDYYDSYDYRTGDAMLVIEYLLYFQFTLKVVKFLWNLYCVFEPSNKPTYDIYGKMDVMCFGKIDISYMYHDSKILTIDRLVEDLVRVQRGEVRNECSII